MMRRTMMSNGVSKFNSDFGLSIFVFECASVLATLGPLFGLGLCAYLCYRASQLLTNCCGQHTNNVFELRWSERTRCSRFASCRLQP